MTGPGLPPGARITDGGLAVYCTVPAHQDGEHSRECLPPADPHNPELRLIRAIWGLCGECDRTDDHDHDRPLRAARGHRIMASSPGQDAERRAADKDRSKDAKDTLNTKIAGWQKDREAQETGKGGSGG